MPINIDVRMEYQLYEYETVLLALEAAETDGQTVIESNLEIENGTLERVDGEGLVGQRRWAQIDGTALCLRYRAKVDVNRRSYALERLTATPMNMLPSEAVTYLRPSRFCQSDLFTAFVTQRFGHLEGGAKIAAIVDWTAAELTYVSGSSSGTTTAMDTFVAREGVCRDYAHLVCSLARAAYIPARYASVYAPAVTPPDFHAVVEVWLDGAWHLVDATGMSSIAETVLIGIGRDAGDVAFMETERWAEMINQSVNVSLE